MYGCKRRCDHLFRPKQMPQICGGVILAGVAGTALVNRYKLALVLCIAQIYSAVFGKDRTDPTENVFPMVRAGKGITEMLLGSEDL